jgi:hypothetical protein
MNILKTSLAVLLISFLSACSSGRETTQASATDETTIVQASSTSEVTISPNATNDEYANDITVVVELHDYTAGKTPEELAEAHQACIDLLTNSGQASNMCEPAENVFGDNTEHKVHFAEGSKLEVDVLEYGDFADFKGMPAVVSQDVAAEMCAQRGMRLPTGDEWEFLATNGGTTRWPWGDQLPTADVANIDTVGGHPAKMNPYYFKLGPNQWNIFNLVGNAPEWTSDQRAAVRGGSSGAIWPFAEPSFKDGALTVAGFRCVKDVQK